LLIERTFLQQSRSPNAGVIHRHRMHSHTEEGTPPSEAKPKTEVGSWYLDEFGNPTREIKGRG
jgi:hypothetical protein